MNKVAIITRTKDRPLFLLRALKSVENQTYKDYVHVIVNDGGDKAEISTLLNTLDAETKKRLRVFYRDSPSNAPDTIFNESIQRVNSKYVVIHDDDDEWHEEFLQRSIAALEDGAKGVLVRTDKVIEELHGDSIVEKKRHQYLPDVRAVNLYRQCIDNQLTPIAFIYKRSAYEAVGGYDDSLAVCGDWDFGLRFLQKYDVMYLDPGFALATYHHRSYKPDVEGNTSFAGNDRHRYWSNYLMNKYLRKELSEGVLGVGYIMSKLRYDESAAATRIRKLLPGFLVEYLKNRVRN